MLFAHVDTVQESNFRSLHVLNSRKPDLDRSPRRAESGLRIGCIPCCSTEDMMIQIDSNSKASPEPFTSKPWPVATTSLSAEPPREEEAAEADSAADTN